jgi:hypothetical protein
MQIIWDQTAVDALKKTHTILELETFDVNGQAVTAYCVVPAEKIMYELPLLDRYKELHSGFVRAYYEKNYMLCQDIAEHLIGKFGGELDTFYQEILSRIKTTT